MAGYYSTIVTGKRLFTLRGWGEGLSPRFIQYPGVFHTIVGTSCSLLLFIDQYRGIRNLENQPLTSGIEVKIPNPLKQKLTCNLEHYFYTQDQSL